MSEDQVIGPWPSEFSVVDEKHVAEGLVVRSLSGAVEGRTTGHRRPCSTTECPGWFIGVRWESGQLMFICSQGWTYDPGTGSIRVTAGHELAARYVALEDADLWPREDWVEPDQLHKWAGWRLEAPAMSEDADGA